MSTYDLVVTSPATWTRPVVTMVSTATRLFGSWASNASRMASLIWSQILSGWPSVTDSDVKRRSDTALPYGCGDSKVACSGCWHAPGSEQLTGGVHIL